MPSGRRLRCLVAVLALCAATGCAAGDGDSEESASEAAFTVDRGDRFVVSATPTRIVLRKRVDKTVFPFDEGALEGKAVLIHPVDKRADAGVYARALAVRSEGDTFVIAARPLSLAEMEQETEDDIVRIFIDGRRRIAETTSAGLDLDSVYAQDVAAPGLSGPGPSAPPLLPLPAPVPVETFQTAALGLEIGLDLGQPDDLAPSVTLKHDIRKSAFRPEALMEWSDANGLELGMRASFEWDSTLTVTGSVVREFYRSRTLSSKPVIVTLPIGPAPVPVAITASTSVVCEAELAAPVAFSVRMKASAKIGASMRVKAGLDRAPSTWVTAGRWKPTATGSASLTLGADPNIGAKIECHVPHVDVAAMVGGVAGPYLAVEPRATFDASGASFSTALLAGASAEMLGVTKGVEAELYVWDP